MSSSPPIDVSYTILLSSVTTSGFANSMPLPQMLVTMSAMGNAVLAVGGQIDFREDAAARAERQSGHVRQLRAGGRLERPAAGPSVGLAERLDGDGARRNDVLLDERGRHLQRGGDVVVALGDIVGGQHVARVEVDGEQIAHRVRVFLPVQAMEDDLVCQVRRPCRGGAVERVLEPRHQRIGRRPVGLARSRRRHHPAAEFPYCFLEDLGALPDRVGGDVVEAHAAGFVRSL